MFKNFLERRAKIQNGRNIRKLEDQPKTSNIKIISPRERTGAHMGRNSSVR